MDGVILLSGMMTGRKMQYLGDKKKAPTPTGRRSGLPSDCSSLDVFGSVYIAHRPCLPLSPISTPSVTPPQRGVAAQPAHVRLAPPPCFYLAEPSSPARLPPFLCAASHPLSKP
ncbi:hypothetical protein U1Q18_016101 [Sarracenia purpurea var. burkii]